MFAISDVDLSAKPDDVCLFCSHFPRYINPSSVRVLLDTGGSCLDSVHLAAAGSGCAQTAMLAAESSARVQRNTCWPQGHRLLSFSSAAGTFNGQAVPGPRHFSHNRFPLAPSLCCMAEQIKNSTTSHRRPKSMLVNTASFSHPVSCIFLNVLALTLQRYDKRRNNY